MPDDAKTAAEQAAIADADADSKGDFAVFRVGELLQRQSTLAGAVAAARAYDYGMLLSGCDDFCEVCKWDGFEWETVNP